MSIDISSYFVQRTNGPAHLGGSMPIGAPSTGRFKQLPRSMDILPIDWIHSNSHYYYFTLALPHSLFYRPTFYDGKNIKEYYLKRFKKLATLVKDVKLYISLEYCSDGIHMHTHGVLTNWNNKSFLKLKQQLRKVFDIPSTNRVAIKWYQNNNKNHTARDKIEYHLMGVDYKGNVKDLVDNHIYLITTDSEVISSAISV